MITLAKPEMQNVKRLYNYPKPNYVLQNNASYKTIWNLYKRLLQKSKLLESAWSNRQVVISQFYQLCVINYFRNLNKSINAKHYYFTNPTINLMPSKEGVFINNMGSSIKLIYLENNQTYIQISPLSIDGIMQISIQKSYNRKENYHFNFQYIPYFKYISNEVFFQKFMNLDNNYFMIYKESPNIKINLENKIKPTQIFEIDNTDDAYEKIQLGMNNILHELGAFNDYNRCL